MAMEGIYAEEETPAADSVRPDATVSVERAAGIAPA